MPNKCVLPAILLLWPAVGLLVLPRGAAELHPGRVRGWRHWASACRLGHRRSVELLVGAGGCSQRASSLLLLSSNIINIIIINS